MSLTVSLRSEFLKTKRSPIWILTLCMAAFVPIFLLLIFKEVQDDKLSSQVAVISKDPWNFYFYQATGMISIVFLPMFIVLLSALLPQIEYRNHTWKQVYVSPQSFFNIYLSKFLIVQILLIGTVIVTNLLLFVLLYMVDAFEANLSLSTHKLN